MIENDLRIQVNKFRCAELVSSCALVQNTATGTTPPRAVNPAGTQNNTNIAKMQEAVNESLPKDLQDMLGGDFFQGIRFNLARVTLPKNVQDAVNKAQAAYAAVSEAQARVAQAQADARGEQAAPGGLQRLPGVCSDRHHQGVPAGPDHLRPGRLVGRTAEVTS